MLLRWAGIAGEFGGNVGPPRRGVKRCGGQKTPPMKPRRPVARVIAVASLALFAIFEMLASAFATEPDSPYRKISRSAHEF